MARSRSAVRVAAAAGPQLSGLLEQPGRQPVVGRRPALAEVERALGQHDPPGRVAQLGAVDVPAGDRCAAARAHSRNGSAKTPRRNLHRISESITAARSSVSTAAATCACAAVEAVEVAGEVGLVGAGAVVVGAARVDREPERHRLQRPRLVAGQLQALDVRREVVASPADQRGGGPRSPRRAARRGPRRRPISSSARSSASASPKRSHGASSRPRSAHSIAKAIVPPAEMVSRPSSSHRRAGLEHGVGVGDAAQRAEREHVLVLHPRRAAARARW